MDRKQFLQMGAGLPLAMQSLASWAATEKQPSRTPPRRILFICSCLGFYEPYFYPRSAGELSSSDYLQTIDLKSKITVFRNLFHPGMETSNHDSEKSFLTGAPHPESPTFINEISVDQILARELGGGTRFPFLNLSIYDRGWGISWNDRGSAIPPMHDTGKVFEMLFGEEDRKAKSRRLENDQAILKCLHRDLAHMRQGPASVKKVETYGRLIEELEARLERERFWLSTKKPSVQSGLSDDPTYPFSTKIKNLFELAKLAFRTDSTRIITLSLDWMDGAIKVPGATGGWHTLSHHGGNPKVIDQLSKIEIDTMRHFNSFLNELDEIPEGGGSLLDYTTVVFGSNFGDASNHTCHHLPMIVAGGGYRHQAYQVLKESTPLCNLYLELLHKHGVDVPSFGSSHEDLDLLKG